MLHFFFNEGFPYRVSFRSVIYLLYESNQGFLNILRMSSNGAMLDVTFSDGVASLGKGVKKKRKGVGYSLENISDIKKSMKGRKAKKLTLTLPVQSGLEGITCDEAGDSGLTSSPDKCPPPGPSSPLESMKESLEEESVGIDQDENVEEMYVKNPLHYSKVEDEEGEFIESFDKEDYEELDAESLEIIKEELVDVRLVEQMEVTVDNPRQDQESFESFAEVKQEEKAKQGKNKGLYKKINSEYVCLACESQYKSRQGMNNHFNTMVCGFGTRSEKQTKRIYLGLYSPDGDQYVCDGCFRRYNTVRGVHRHLETHDECGLRAPSLAKQMENVKMKISISKRNFKDLYIKQDERYICLACESYYQSVRGVHHHLINKPCGFGEEKDKKSLKEFYVKSAGKYSCSKCTSEFDHYVGIWRHLKTCIKDFV